MPEIRDWDEESPGAYWHYRVRPPNLFKPNSFRVIDITDGVKSTMGKLKTDTNGTMVPQNVMFDKKKFTLNEAKKWLNDHKQLIK